MDSKLKALFLWVLMLMVFSSGPLFAQSDKGFPSSGNGKSDFGSDEGFPKGLREDERKEETGSAILGEEVDPGKQVKRYFSLGLKGGLVVSSVASSTFNLGTEAGGSFYITSELYLSSLFSLEVDLGFHKTNFSSGSANFGITYFTIPLLVKYYFSRHFLKPDLFQFWGGFGFEPRLKLSDRGFGLGTVSKDRTEGLLFDAGGRVLIHRDLSLNLSFRYYLGLTRVFESTGGGKGLAREFFILVGFSYDLF